MTEEKKYTVLVTGFGPFAGFPVNFSWETVKNLWELDWPKDVKLITRELQVVYDKVREQVPKLWAEFKPDLMIHVGVSGIATKICIEKQSFNKDYCNLDIERKCPLTKCCKDHGDDCLVTEIDVDSLCEKANKKAEESGIQSRCEKSLDPGRYLCGYTYYLSLCEDRSKSLFVHVPPDCVYNTKDMAKSVRYIILAALEQLYQ